MAVSVIAPSAQAIPSPETVVAAVALPEQGYYPSSHILHLEVVVAEEEDENRIAEAVAWASIAPLALGLASASVMASAQASRQAWALVLSFRRCIFHRESADDRENAVCGYAIVVVDGESWVGGDSALLLVALPHLRVFFFPPCSSDVYGSSSQRLQLRDHRV
jgi:hypothetical protein